MHTREIAYLHYKIGFQAVLCMHTREIEFLHWEINFQALFMHVYLQIQYILENRTEMIVQNDRWEMIAGSNFFDKWPTNDRSFWWQKTVNKRFRTKKHFLKLIL